MQRRGQMEKAGSAMREIEAALSENDAFQFWLFRNRWKDFAGELLAKESSIARRDGAVLYIHVTNSVFMNELMMYKAELLSRIQKDPYGKQIRELRFAAASARPSYEGVTEAERIRARYEAAMGRPKAEITEKEAAWLSDFVKRNVAKEELRAPIEAMMEGALRRRKAELAEGAHPCAVCGDLCAKDERLCPRCRIEEARQVKNRLILLLKERPELLYEDAARVVPAEYGAYAEARDVLIHRYRENAYRGEGTEEELRRLLSLLLHKPYEEITKEEAEKALEGLPRRAKYQLRRK